MGGKKSAEGVKKLRKMGRKISISFGVGLAICWSMSMAWHTILDKNYVIISKTNGITRFVGFSVGT